MTFSRFWSHFQIQARHPVTRPCGGFLFFSFFFLNFHFEFSFIPFLRRHQPKPARDISPFDPPVIWCYNMIGCQSPPDTLTLAALPAVLWATQSSDWGGSTNGEWQDVTKTGWAANQHFHYPQEMQKTSHFRITECPDPIAFQCRAHVVLGITPQQMGHFTITSGVAPLGIRYNCIHRTWYTSIIVYIG